MPVRVGDTTCVPVHLVNPNPVEVMIHKGTKVAVVEQLGMTSVMSVSEEPARMLKAPPMSKEKQEMLWQMVEKSGEKLSESENNQLYLLLSAYADVFFGLNSLRR